MFPQVKEITEKVTGFRDCYLLTLNLELRDKVIIQGHLKVKLV